MYLRQSIHCFTRGYDRFRGTTTCTVWTGLKLARTKGVVSSVVQGVDAVTDVLEASINRVWNLTAQP